MYVEHAPNFASNRRYILNRALEQFRGAGLRHRILDRADRRNTGAAAFVHVDLTDVPPRHRPSPGAYALCLNGEATSISRLRYSRARLGPNSAYQGPVVVKSVLNSRGLPELNYLLATSRTFRLECRFLRLLGRVPRRMRCPPYALYDSLDAVPDAVWRDPDRIVERFLPGLLATPVVKYRCDFFLDVVLHTRGTYDSLLADPDTVREITLVDSIPNEVLRVRADLRLDFGSMDYFVVDGEAVVVDVNKTTAYTEDWLRMFPRSDDTSTRSRHGLLKWFGPDPAASRRWATKSGSRAMGSPLSAGASEVHDGLFRRRVQLADGFEATLENRFHPPTDADLRIRTALLAVSVKNRRFSNALIAAFCRASQERFAAGVVTVVDSPYERNVVAGCGTPDRQRREIETLRRVADEARIRVRRIVARHGGGAVSIEPWDALAAETPEWLTRGIRAAWGRRGRFHADVLAQSRAVLPNAPAHALERYAEFMLEELPILLHRYYFRHDEVVDVYPGPQPVVFWRIEAGVYADEMPDLAERLCTRGGLIYARVGARIRPMRPTELEAVVGVWQRSREQFQLWCAARMDGSAEDDRRHFRDFVARQSQVWLAVEDGQILGFLALAGTQVSHLHVDPAALRRGVGSALLEWAKALSPGGITLFTHQRNELARAFYVRRGFREVRLAVGRLPECGPEVELAWEPGNDKGGPSSTSA